MKGKNDSLAVDLLDQFALGIILWLIAIMGDIAAILAEGCSQIAHDVTQLSSSRGWIRHHQHAVVGRLQIPIVQQDHQYLQTLKLLGSVEWVVVPIPLVVDTLDTFRPRFKASIFDNTFSFDRNLGHVIVDIGKISGRPYKSAGSSLRLGLVAKLNSPFHSLGIFDDILRRMARLFFFHKCHARKIWFHGVAAYSKKQIARGDVSRLAPEHRGAGAGVMLLAVLFLFFVLLRLAGQS